MKRFRDVQKVHEFVFKVPSKRVVRCKKDPQRTSKPNGWIYACFEPVEITEEEDEEETENKSLLIKNATSCRPCYMDYLSGKNGFLNALNLMSINEAKENGGTTLLVSEDALIKRLPLTTKVV